MKAKGKKAASPARVFRDAPVDTKIERWLALSQPSRLMGSRGISFDRLEQIESEINNGAPIDETLRLEISQLIAHILSLQDAKRGRGAPRDSTLGTLARMVGALHELHAIPIAEAARALVRGGAGEEEFNRAKAIERAYQRLKKNGGKYQISEHLVQVTLARIRAQKVGA